MENAKSWAIVAFFAFFILHFSFRVSLLQHPANPCTDLIGHGSRVPASEFQVWFRRVDA
jgi:hypothetical protein